MKATIKSRKSRQSKRQKAHTKVLAKLNACPEAVEFGNKYKTLQAAWDSCERGDWMLWLLGKLAGPVGSDSRKRLLVVVCECVRLALPYTKDLRVLKCSETIEAYSRGEATIEQVNEARRDAYAAVVAYAVAYAAAYAAADAVAYAAAYAADAVAADAAADAATYVVADAAARSKVLKQCADIVRKHYPEAPKVKDIK